MKHLLSIKDLDIDDIKNILNLSKKLKSEQRNGLKHHHLEGKTLAMIFTKSSTRTRVSFETGMYQLGGHPLFLNSNDIQIGRGETIEDTAKVLSRYVDAIMIRTFKHSDVEGLAKYGSVPVINGLTDLLHPCQVLTDLFTIQEQKQKLKGLKMAYIGDGNNMANSLLYGCSKMGINLSIASPKGYECDKDIYEYAKNLSQETNCEIVLTTDPVKAITDTDVVYTDTWSSMGQEEEKQKREKVFQPYRIDKKLFSNAKEDAIFMHCLPAYRGFEMTADIIDGPNSVVFEEAENRLHVQKAIMVMLLDDMYKPQLYEPKE